MMKFTANILGYTGSVLCFVGITAFLISSLIIPGSAKFYGYVLIFILLAFSWYEIKRAVMAWNNARPNHGVVMIVACVLFAFIPLMLLIKTPGLAKEYQGASAILGSYGLISALVLLAGGIITLLTREVPYPFKKLHYGKEAGIWQRLLAFASGAVNMVLAVPVFNAAEQSFEKTDDITNVMLTVLIILLLLLSLAGAFVRLRDRLSGGLVQLLSGGFLLLILLTSIAFREFTPLTAGLVACQLVVITSGVLTIRNAKPQGEEIAEAV